MSGAFARYLAAHPTHFMEHNMAINTANTNELIKTGKDTLQKGVESLRDNAGHITEEAQAYMQDQIENLSLRMEDLSQQMKDRAVQVDQHIKTNPYLYLLGAAGLGFVLAKLTQSSAAD